MEMSVSTFQKITFLSCLVLCVSLFLPRILFSRGKKDIVQPKIKVGPGHAPRVRYISPFPAEGAGRQGEDGVAESYYTELMSRVKTATKPTLLAQVIPVYGFGIFLYIIYIFFKLTHTPTKQEHTVPISTQPTTAPAAACHYGALNPSEAAPIQVRLTRMEGVTGESTSKAFPMSARARRHSRQRGCRKLPLLKESMRVLLEGRPLEGVSPEREAEETPYTLDWEGYSEETFPQVSFCGCRRFPSVILEEPDVDVPTAEELAERMEREEEEEDEEEDAEEDKEMANNELLGEDKGGDTENSPTQLKDDDKTEEEEEEEEDDDDDDDDDESCSPGDEEEETKLKIQKETEEGYGAEMVEEGDDEEDNQQAKEEEEENGEEEMSEEHPCLPHKSVSVEEGVRRNRKQITFSDHRHVFHYPKSGTVGCEYENVEEWPNKDYIEDDEKYEDDDDNDDDDFEEKDGQHEGEKEVLGRPEEDPLMEAESLGFSTEVEWEPEEQEIDLVDFLLTYQPDTTITSNQPASTRPETPPSGTLRMRNKRQKKEH